MEKTEQSRARKILSALIIVAALVGVTITIALLGRYGALIMVLVIAVVGGLAAYLKLKDTWVRIASLFLFGLALFWLLSLPFWFMSQLHR